MILHVKASHDDMIQIWYGVLRAACGPNGITVIFNSSQPGRIKWLAICFWQSVILSTNIFV